MKLEDQRRFQRVRPSGIMSRTGTIFVNVKSPAVACNIVDVSAGGACIEVHGTAPIPHQFVLNNGGVKKTCYLIWQKGRRIGVAF